MTRTTAFLLLLTFLLPYADRVVLVGEHGTALEVERLGKIGKKILKQLLLFIFFSATPRLKATRRPREVLYAVWRGPGETMSRSFG